MMLRLILLFLALFINTAPAEAKREKAQPAEPAKYQNKPVPLGATQWHCHYDGGSGILCDLASAGRTASPVNLAARLPRLVHDILNTPEELTGSTVAIPLHTIPFDMEMVGKLAEAAMCGAKPMCGIVFGENRTALLAHIAAGAPLMLAAR